MGALSGNTGIVKFNTYLDLNDQGSGVNDWGDSDFAGGVEYLPTVTSNCNGDTKLMCCSGNSNTGPVTVYPSTLVGKDINIKIPLGAIAVGFESRMRGGTWTFPDYDHTEYGLQIYDSGKVGNNKAAVSRWPTVISGTAWQTRTRGGASDMWGLDDILGFNKVNGSQFGLAYNARYYNNNGTCGGCTPVDHIYMKIYWKQTGVMMAM